MCYETLVNVLLIRGLSREARHWGRFVDDLQSQDSIRDVLCLDLPGVGTELDQAAPGKVSQIVDGMRLRWQDAIRDVEGPWAVLGISFGGMIGLDWCCRYPGDFKGLIVGNTSASNLGLPHERMTPKAMKHVLKSNLEKDPFAREKMILEIVSNDAKKRASVARAWGTIAKESPIRRGTFLRQLVAATAYRSPETCPVPVLILASTGDRFVDVRCSERLAARLGGRLEYHPTAGHAITLDAPEWVAEKSSQWLEELSA
jgi:pimeloyl-[acyl-carrier protein] methyl ester esterase